MVAMNLYRIVNTNFPFFKFNHFLFSLPNFSSKLLPYLRISIDPRVKTKGELSSDVLLYTNFIGDDFVI